MRLATLSDVRDIVNLFENTKADWDEKILRNVFSNSRDQQFIFEKNKKIVGYLCVQDNVDCIALLQICVDPQYQRQGIAAQLCAAVFSLFQKPVQLEVRMSNERAISFYQKMGFITQGVRKKYYRDGEDALLMQLTICT